MITTHETGNTNRANACGPTLARAAGGCLPDSTNRDNLCGMTQVESHPAPARGPQGTYLLTLSLAALGVVYGDIGTSPLYAFRECFHGPHAIAPTRGNILGVLSLVFWALIVVISGKYLAFVLRADNQGEGGILALTALATPIKVVSRTERWPLVLLGIFGAALLYGDGMITPAISVLSAVEGLQVATPIFTPYVVPITIVILIGLFLIQSRGTGAGGADLWAGDAGVVRMLAVLGIRQIVAHPERAGGDQSAPRGQLLRPERLDGYLVLGTVVLVITGGESLYVDLGHFGRRPIRMAWFAVVLPALLLNYFGQGALLIADPEARENPFFLLAPAWVLYPLVALATCATVIASQAVISGAFSITMQAVQLGFLPAPRRCATPRRREIGPDLHPGRELGADGRVHPAGHRVPSRRSNLAAAYGIAVISTMTITSTMFLVVARERWHWSLLRSRAGRRRLPGRSTSRSSAPTSSRSRMAAGSRSLAALVIFTLMTTWKRGRRALARC